MSKQTLEERLGEGCPPYWLINKLLEIYKTVEEERNRAVIVDLIDDVVREWALPKVMTLDTQEGAGE